MNRAANGRNMAIGMRCDAPTRGWWVVIVFVQWQSVMRLIKCLVTRIDEVVGR